MPLLSSEFVFFFLAFFPLYWAFKSRPAIQNGLLLIASLGLLYYLDWRFMAAVVGFLLFISLASQGLNSQAQGARKLSLGVSILGGLLMLSFFKYVDFFRPALQEMGLLDEATTILMPLGLSYYVFQSIAYVWARYRQPQRADLALNWRDLLLHFSFFPTITAGPIARTDSFKTLFGTQQGMSAQLTAPTREIINPALAVSLILLGIIKKWWLAGTVATLWVDPVFENPMQYDSWTILSGIYAYTLQLFFDFSGYSDLVVGIAMLLGFQLPMNFAMPLRAFNIRDFWNRWHISLSSWIRDHIYIPLGGSKGGFFRTQVNLLIAMTLSGVWHGYGWNFFLWGLLHGVALVLLNIGDRLFGAGKAERDQRDLLAQTGWLGKALGVFVTFHFVCFTFVVFRTSDINESITIFDSLFNNPFALSYISGFSALFLSGVALLLISYPFWAGLFNRFVQLLTLMPTLSWIFPITLLLFFIILFAPSGIPGFIYANF